MTALGHAAGVVVLDERDVERHLSVGDAHRAVRRAFELLGAGLADNPPRQRQRVGDAQANTMWAAAPTLGALAAKLYPIVRTDVTRGSGFTVVLHRLPEGDVRAVLCGELLGQRRTGAASGVAARVLARPDSSVLGIVGAGGQARHQVEALMHALPFARAMVAGRSPRRRDELVAALSNALDIPVEAAEPEAVAAEADVLATITGASEPVLRGDWLRPGTLVVAAGSNVADKRELDRGAIERCDRIFVDDLEVARRECGDLIANGIDVDVAQPLATALDRPQARVAADEIVLFESHGLAIQDLTCALHVAESAEGEAA